MNNLLSGIENIKLPTVVVAVDEDTLRNLFLTALLSGVALMAVYALMFKNTSK